MDGGTEEQSQGLCHEVGLGQMDLSSQRRPRRGEALVGDNDGGSPGIPRDPCAGPSNPPAVLPRVT